MTSARSLSRVKALWRHLFRRQQVEADLDAEVQSHFELLAEANAIEGMNAQEARRAAKIEVGGTEQVKEKVRAVRSSARLDALFQDLGFGFRMLRKDPGFTAVAVLTLALGIGVNTAIFSVVNAVLLRPLLSSQADRVVSLRERVPGFSLDVPFSAPDYVAFAERQHSFETMAAYSDEHLELSGNDSAERVEASRVSATLFPLLGVQPLLGRGFTDEDDQTGRHLAVLSYALWEGRYGGDPNIIGRTIELDRGSYTVVGVMPKSFEFPSRGPKFNSDPAQLWVPMGFTAVELQSWGQMYNHSVLGLLKPGLTVAQARSDATDVIKQVMERYPAGRKFAGLGLSAGPYENEVVGDVRTPLMVLMGAVALVLLISCANVANLLLVRASVRHREMAIRAALGAGRGRLIQQMLLEGLLLALGAGATGVLAAFCGLRFLLSLAPATLPRLQAVRIDDSVLTFTFAVSLLTTAIFGLIPSLTAGRTDPHEGLKEGAHGATAARGRSGAQNVLIVSQMALAVMLLIGAGLLLRSFQRLLETDPGFQPKHVLTMTIPLPYQAYSRATDVRRFFTEVLLQVSGTPGVMSAGACTDLPFSPQERDPVGIEGRDSRNLPGVVQSWVQGDYFDAMGITLKRGRLFTPEDRLGALRVVVISETAARIYWPGKDPIGKRMNFSDGWHTVIGIVGDVKDSTIQDAAAPHTYTPYAQVSDSFLQLAAFFQIRTLNVALRTEGDPTKVASDVRRQLNSLDPESGIDVRTAEASIQESLAPQRFNLSLLGLFAGLAVFLASVGVYGVLSYRMAQRSHEIGVRIALGAQPPDVLMLVLRTGMSLVGIGAAIGILLALVLARLLASMLYEVRADDPITFVSVIFTLLAAALLACYIPARRAMKIDPMTALRFE